MRVIVHVRDVGLLRAVLEVMTMSSRNRPTAPASFRRGARPPQKSSLHVFVLLGLAVGLFAFGVMSLCLEDPFAKIAARGASKTASPVVAALVTPPLSAPPAAVAADPMPAPAQQTVATTTATKTPRAHRPRARKAVKTAALPTNPYATID